MRFDEDIRAAALHRNQMLIHHYRSTFMWRNVEICECGLLLQNRKKLVASNLDERVVISGV